MRFHGESLACFTMLDDVPSVVEGQKPVEPRSKSLSDEGSAAGMMATGSFMNISEEGDSILRCYAPLENLMRTSLRLIQPLHLQPHFLSFHNSKDLSQELVHAN
jgi:hypothetical protein